MFTIYMDWAPSNLHVCEYTLYFYGSSLKSTREEKTNIGKKKKILENKC